MAEVKDEKPKAKLKYKLPKTIGGAIDLMYKVREARKAMQRKADDEKAQESLIEVAIFERFGKSELEGARGKAAQASITRKDVYNVDDFEAIWKYAVKNDAPDLFRRQLVNDAVRARLDAGKTIPGMSVFTKVGLSLTKRK